MIRNLNSQVDCLKIFWYQRMMIKLVKQIEEYLM